MPKVPLTTGFYVARSVVAECQRCLNMVPERNPSDAVFPYTSYNSPGLVALGTAPNKPARGLYWTNTNQLAYVAGDTVYRVSQDWTLTKLGNIADGTTPVSMADNGTTLLLVDGTPNGYQIDLATGTFSQVSAATNSPSAGSGGVFGFFGATRVDTIDGFMVLNQPGTQNFYTSQENNVIFDALNFAAKNGYSDLLVTIIVTRREIWLIGEKTTEIWFDAGAPDFPFQIIPGPFIQHGCSAPYSVAQIDGVIFWLSQDQAGNLLVARAEGYVAKSISTPAIVQEWEKYPTTTDAVGFCFQVGGHPYFQLNFPSADRSWRWDESTSLWHEVAYTDNDGVDHRHRAQCAINAYGVTVAADWQTGQLYQIDPNATTDAGQPMYFRRGFPSFVDDGHQVSYPGFVLDCETATSTAQPGMPQPLLTGLGEPIFAGPVQDELLAGPAPAAVASPVVNLRWSDTGGRTWGQPVAQSLGDPGKYLTQPQWNRLGRGRRRTFECYGVIPGRMAINGAWLDPQPIKLGN